jgi:hypothetical protein
MALAQKRKKLYFTVDLRAVTRAVFPCTVGPGTSAVVYTGDKYGAVLDKLTALTTGSSNQAKRANSVSAFFEKAVAGNAATATAGQVFLQYCNWTRTASGATALIPAESAATPDGATPIYTSDFGVLVRRSGTLSFRGTLYVQRQHSIEV